MSQTPDEYRRELLHNAERSVLAMMMLKREGAEAARAARATLAPGDFDLPAHGKVFAAVLAIHDRGVTADLLTLADELLKRDELARVGGEVALTRIMERAVTTANVAQPVAIVLDAALRREAITQARTLNHASHDMMTPLAETLKITRERLDGIEARQGPEDSRTLSGVDVIRFSDVKPEAVRWLWPSWIPRGMLTVLDGDPGLGKSVLTLDLAARLSRGDTMPDGQSGPEASGVVILSAEDDLARVIRPRLDVAGADVARIVTVRIVAEGEGREPTITPADLSAIEQGIAKVAARLLIVDPLMAYLPADVNAHRDQDVRRALSSLRALAERTGTAVLVVRHLNKTESANALYRGGGSIGIVGAARAGLMLAPDPDDGSGEGRVLAVVKANLAPRPASLRLRLVADPGGPHPRVSWEGACEHTPETLLAIPMDPERREREEARERDAETRARQLDCARTALRHRVAEWEAAGEPMRARVDAVPFLMDQGLSRDAAREVIREGIDRHWRQDGSGRRGDPELLRPLYPDGSPPESANAESPHLERPGAASIPAGRVDTGPPETTSARAALGAASVTPDSGGGMDSGPPETTATEAALDAAPSGSTDTGGWSAGDTRPRGGDGDADGCPCGGRLIRRSFGFTCTACHRRFPHAPATTPQTAVDEASPPGVAEMPDPIAAVVLSDAEIRDSARRIAAAARGDS